MANYAGEPQTAKINYEYDLCPINQRYLSRKFILSKRYREAKEKIAWVCKSQYRGEMIEGEISVDLVISYPRKIDIDSMVKVILDSMQGIIFKNDSQIFKLAIWKRKGECGFKADIQQMPYTIS